jgi:hypothetical protein
MAAPMSASTPSHTRPADHATAPQTASARCRRPTAAHCPQMPLPSAPPLLSRPQTAQWSRTIAASRCCPLLADPPAQLSTARS